MRYLEHSPKKVWLVGMGPSWTDMVEPLMTQEACPDLYDEIWAVNMAANLIWHDVVFWMDDLDAQEKFKPGLISMLRRRNKPVITSKSYPDILPCSYDYPLNETAPLWQDLIGFPYFTNSIAQAIAYGMVIGVETMRIYGADFTYPNRDYAESGRACVEAWIMLAHTRGMKVEVARRSSLFDAVSCKGVYGYRTPPKIILPDGKEMTFVPMQEAAHSPALQQAFTPQQQVLTDAELPGIRPDGDGPLSEEAGTGRPVYGEFGAGTPDAGAVPKQLHDSGSTQPSAAPRSGKGLRGRGDAKRHEGPDPASPGNG